MKSTAAHPRDSRRGWASRTGRTVAALAAYALLVAAAACGGPPTGGGPPNAGGGPSSAAGSAQSQRDLAYAQCMRAHGVADFPDPNPGGGFGGSITSQVQHSPNFATANSACRNLLPGGGTANKVQDNQSAFLQHAQCMRAHGVPNYPDPNPGVNPRTALQQAGIDPNSPQVQAASQTCAQLLPARSASPSQGGGS